MPEPTPKFEIKKYKTFMGMDCPGYNLDLWQDGKLIAYVLDDGSGGEVRFTYVENGKEVFHSETQKKFEAYCESLPPLPPDPRSGSDTSLDMDAALFVGCILIPEFEIVKKVRRDCSKRTCLKKPDDPKGAYSVWNTPFSPTVKEGIAKKYPTGIFLNETPESEWAKLVLSGPDIPPPKRRR